MWFMNNAMAKPDNAGAGSTDYMHLFGLVALGYMWARMAKASAAALASGDATDAAFHQTKLTLAKHFMERHMPETALRLARVSAGADTIMGLDAEAF
jgi:acyl-CoA dehydrogenase